MPFFFVVFMALLASFATFKMRKFIRNAERLKNDGIRAIGVVTGYKARWNRGVTFHPRIQFTTANSRIVEVEGPTGASIPLYRKGTKISIYYEAEDPENFAINSEFEQFAPYLGIFLAWLMVAILLGVWFNTDQQQISWPF